MSDYTANGDLHHAKRVNKAEFVIYFALIVCLAILPHMIGWAYQLIRPASLPRLNPSL